MIHTGYEICVIAKKNIHINGIQEICSPGDPEKDVTLHFYLSVEKEYETTECCVLFN